MYDFSGLYYRIFGTDCIILFMCGLCLFWHKPWKNKFSNKIDFVFIFGIVFGLVFGLIHLSGIIKPNVKSFTSEFVEEYRDSRVAPPLPFTTAYVFEGGEEPDPIYYLDIFSKKKIFPDDFEEGKTYTVYYDSFTKVIVKVEPNDVDSNSCHLIIFQARTDQEESRKY